MYDGSGQSTLNGACCMESHLLRNERRQASKCKFLNKFYNNCCSPHTVVVHVNVVHIHDTCV